MIVDILKLRNKENFFEMPPCVWFKILEFFWLKFKVKVNRYV